MFYQSSISNVISNIVGFNRIFSGLTIVAATIPFVLIVTSPMVIAEDQLPTIEIHFEVLDELVAGDPFQMPMQHSPFATKLSKPLEKKSSEIKAVQAKPSHVSKKKQKSVTAKADKISKTTFEMLTVSPDVGAAPVLKSVAPKPDIPIAPEPKPEPKFVMPELPAPPKEESKVESKPDIPIAPEPKPEPKFVMPELPAPPKEESKVESKPDIPIAPEPKPEPKFVMPELPAPPKEESKVESKFATPVVPESKPEPKFVMPELPAPPKEESKVESKSEEPQSSSVSIAPMPLPPTPDVEFAKALNSPESSSSVPEENVPPVGMPSAPEAKPVVMPTELGAEDVKKINSQYGKLLSSVKFISTETELPLSVEQELKDLVVKVKAGNGHLTLVAYASESADQSTTARRVSLSRVLAVRAFLIEQGINKMNINVHAEGSKNAGGEPNRVDIFMSDVKSK